jgi:gas vesicle protein
MNNEILKKTLLHYINLEYYANGIDEEFQTLLKELEERCKKVILSQKTLNTKTDYSLMYKAVKEEVEKFRKELEERLDEEAERIMNQELEFLDETYNEPVEEGKVNGTLIALGGITATKLLFAPIDGRDTTAQFAERTGKNILRSYENSLRAGYLFGQDTESITSQINNGLRQAARGMQSGIRTAIPSYAKTTDRIVFLNNEVEVVWVATLDGRTCISCAAMSGLRFKSISEAPGILHAMCRCIICPVNAIENTVPLFEEFIESLSEEEQLQVLGKNRYELYKDGIPLEKFLNNGTVIKLKDLNID